MLLFGKNISSWPVAARGISAALALFLISSLSVTTGCGAFGMTYSLTGLTVEPNAACIGQGATGQFTAYGTYTEGGHSAKTEDITDSVNWSSDLSEVASINSSGLATAGTIGLTNIEASTQGEFGLLYAYSNLTVKNDCVSDSMVPSLNVVPATSTLTNIGDSERPLAIAFSPRQARATDVTQQVTWQSADPAVAVVNAAGRITATGPGKTTITATRRLPDGTVVSATQTVDVSGPSQDQ